jgi:hypothetical protein
MPKGPQTFKGRDLTRAIKSTLAAGVSVVRAEIEPRTGKIIVVLADPKHQAEHTPNGNPWDEVLKP